MISDIALVVAVIALLSWVRWLYLRIAHLEDALEQGAVTLARYADVVDWADQEERRRFMQDMVWIVGE